MMEVVKKLVEVAEGANPVCLSDASKALQTAADTLKIPVQRCFAHVSRLPDGTKRNSKQGTKGSLYRYVKNTMKCTAQRTMKVIAHVIARIDLAMRFTDVYVFYSLSSLFSS